MFLLKAIQDKYLYEDNIDDVAFLLFNVKGKDLLAIDEPNEFENATRKKYYIIIIQRTRHENQSILKMLIYYPYSKNKVGNTYLSKEEYDNQRALNKAMLYKYDYEDDKDNLNLMFASLDDPNQTIDSILNYIISKQGNFDNLTSWSAFLEEIQEKCQAGGIWR